MKKILFLVVILFLFGCRHKYYYSTGELKAIIYGDTLNCKEALVYYKNGVLKASKQSKDGKSIWNFYYEDSNLKSSGVQIEDFNPLMLADTSDIDYSKFLNFQYFTYYSNGQLKSHFNFVNDYVVKETNYYENGKIKELGCFDSRTNKPFGEWKEYYSDGQVKWVGLYNDGVRQSYYGEDSLQYLSNLPLKLEIYRGNNLALEVGKKYRFRIVNEKIHESEFLVDVLTNCNQSVLIEKDNTAPYPYSFTLDSCSVLEFSGGRKCVAVAVWFPNHDGYIARGAGSENHECIFVPMENEEDDYFRHVKWLFDSKTGKSSFAYPSIGEKSSD